MKDIRKRKALASLLRSAGTLILMAVFVLAVSPLILRLAGYEMYHIVSNSMEPAIPTGSLVVARKFTDTQTEIGELAGGDIIVYHIGERVICHRIVSVEGLSVVTKGDASEENDPGEVYYTQIEGKLVRILPGMGKAYDFVSTLSGRLLLLALVFFIFALRKPVGRLELPKGTDGGK